MARWYPVLLAVFPVLVLWYLFTFLVLLIPGPGSAVYVLGFAALFLWACIWRICFPWWEVPKAYFALFLTLLPVFISEGFIYFAGRTPGVVTEEYYLGPFVTLLIWAYVGRQWARWNMPLIHLPLAHSLGIVSIILTGRWFFFPREIWALSELTVYSEVWWFAHRFLYSLEFLSFNIANMIHNRVIPLPGPRMLVMTQLIALSFWVELVGLILMILAFCLAYLSEQRKNALFLPGK